MVRMRRKMTAVPEDCWSSYMKSDAVTREPDT
jgi:hypothetical protein